MAHDFKKFNEYLNSIPLEELQAENDKQLDKTAKDFEEFKQALSKGDCSLCGNPVTHFSERKPCPHWLLAKAKGFKKKHFPLLYAVKSFHQLNPYCRWVANSGDEPIKNINDLDEERSPNKIIEETIRYKNLEWSFSCAKSDMDGHKESHEGKMPHYHFQMKIDGKVVINYGGFHIPFSEYDMFCFAVKRGDFDRIRGGHIEGAGMQTLVENISAQELLDSMRKAPGDDESKMTFNIQTLVEAEKDTTISGAQLAELAKEHNETGVPMAKLLQRLKNVRSKTVISPGPGVPDIAARLPNRQKRKEPPAV